MFPPSAHTGIPHYSRLKDLRATSELSGSCFAFRPCSSQSMPVQRLLATHITCSHSNIVNSCGTATISYPEGTQNLRTQVSRKLDHERHSTQELGSNSGSMSSWFPLNFPHPYGRNSGLRLRAGHCSSQGLLLVECQAHGLDNGSKPDH